MLDPPTAPENAAEEANPGTPAEKSQSQKRLGIKEFILSLIIIFLVWLGRRFFGP